MSRTLAIVALGLALLVAVGLALRPGPANGLTFTFTDGRSTQLDEMRGRPIVLNFWSVNCPTCIADMPDWIALHPVLTKQNALLLGISIPQDPPPVIIETIKQLKLPFPTVFDVHGEISRAFNTRDITPTTIILDREGKIADRMIGELDPESIKATLATL